MKKIIVKKDYFRVISALPRDVAVFISICFGQFGRN